MRLFLYEHVTATTAAGIDDPLHAEAVAMRDALAVDLNELDGIETVAASAARFGDTVAASDAVWLIAPEAGGVLTSLARRVERLGGRLVSPGGAFCEWATDKSRVADTLRAAGVPMPRGVLLRAGDAWPTDFPLPAVMKPNDGCGSQGVVLVGNALLGVPSEQHRRNATEGAPCRIEEYVPGVAASVALLGGPAGVFLLPACAQRLADDGTFAYLGGSCPLPPALASRAEGLARRAAAAMPAWVGYLGVDLVLGEAADGSQDVVIEVNPRLTTSYVGLRAMSTTNLARAVLDVAMGRVPQLAWRDEVVEFDADGTVRSAGTSPAAK